MLLVAVDIGGTFTDLAVIETEGGTIVSTKALVTPDDLSESIRTCLATAGVDIAAADVFMHGTTTAINTVIERRGVKTALVTTRGARDIYLIGRGNRPDAYNLNYRRATPLVRRRDIYEIDERGNARGEVVRPLDERSVARVGQALRVNGTEAIAICLLHSYADPGTERRVRDLLAQACPDAYVTISSDIIREYREYERTSTVVLNAYIGPVVGKYLRNLEGWLSDAGFSGQARIMQSNGGVCSVENAVRKPIALLESGPVAGIAAAAKVGASLNYGNLIAFDMGGTTAKASLVERGVPTIREDGFVGSPKAGLPVMLPTVDVLEVGFGGGSIASVDQFGKLSVGPRSAGSVPGPACYGRGGEAPTITDADVVLGRIGSDAFLSSKIRLDVAAAEEAVRQGVAEPLGMSVQEAALAVTAIAELNMSLAVREVSVARGMDPRACALLAFGGAGPLHATNIARRLDVPVVVVPNFPAQFSAVGMLLSGVRHDYVRTMLRRLDDARLDDIEDVFLSMEGDAAEEAGRDSLDDMRMTSYLDLRYVGQEFPVALEIQRPAIATSKEDLTEGFERLHKEMFSYSSPTHELEVVNLRMVVTGDNADVGIMAGGNAPEGLVPEPGRRDLFGSGSRRAVYRASVHRRDELPVGAVVRGPAIVQEATTSTYLEDGDTLQVAENGELIVDVTCQRETM